MFGKKIDATTQSLPMVGKKTGAATQLLPMVGKIATALLLATVSAQAGIQIVDFDDASGSGTETVACVFKQVSARAGDMIVVAAATNKKGSVSPVSLVQSGGSGTTGAPTQLTNGMGTYPTSWGWHLPVTSTGTVDFKLTATSITMGGVLYVVRADSGQVMLADSAIRDDNDTADNGASYALNYSFETNLTSGVVIEAVSTRTDTAIKPATYSENYNGSGKRVVTSFDGATDTIWSSTYTVSGGTANKQSSGAIGMVFAEGSGGETALTEIAPNDPNLIFQGSEYITTDASGVTFQRHSDAVLALSSTEKGFSTQRAKTTTGISLLFKTDSDSIDVEFSHDLSEDVENRNSRFGIYEDGQFTGSYYFPKTQSNLTFTIRSESPGTASVFQVVLPNWSKPDFRGLTLNSGTSLLPYTPPAKKKVVVFGDSISHGTGQGATYETYPWIVSELLNVELYNIAVGGGKVSVPAAEMLSEFPPIDLISILIGYNDLHGAGKTAAQYETDLNAMIDAMRTSQPNAEIICISPTFTTNPTNTTTGETIQNFRQGVYDAVADRQIAGDGLIHLIRGEEISSAADLNDPVHLSVAGAANFATNLFTLMEPILNPPVIPQTERTNFIFVVIDDLGWMDLAVQGSKFYETPRIDALAASGIRFTQGYTPHPRCLPARYGFMTGHFPGANGVPGGWPENNLRPEETTLGEALQSHGYATCFAGKWHLIGTHHEENLPQNQGFDTNIAGGHPGAPPTYFFPYRKAGEPAPTDELAKNALFLNNDTPAGGTVTDRITGDRYIRSATRGAPGEYITDRLTDEVIDWMTCHADDPMFICMHHYGVHTPFEAPAELVAKYTAKLETMDYGDLPEYIPAGIGDQKMRQDNAIYAAMIESVDTNIGRLLDQLDSMGIADNTVIVFTADNGGLSNRGGNNNRELATSNFPLRTGKGWLYEGGIREAFMVKGPGIPASINTNSVVTGTDIYPTLLDLAGLPLQPDDHQDGVSFAPALRGETYTRGKPIFWHSPQARPYSTGDFNSSAIRDGDYKLLWFYDTPGQPFELYNVKIDIGENNDLSTRLPDIAASLLAKLKAWHNGAHNGSGVVFRPDDDDVAKPPSDKKNGGQNPPLSLQHNGNQVNLSWDNWTGYGYTLWSRTNLISGTWKTVNLTTNHAQLAMNTPNGFYKVELNLEPES